jgi:hypothetical protein
MLQPGNVVARLRTRVRGSALEEDPVCDVALASLFCRLVKARGPMHGLPPTPGTAGKPMPYLALRREYDGIGTAD